MNFSLTFWKLGLNFRALPKNCERYKIQKSKLINEFKLMNETKWILLQIVDRFQENLCYHQMNGIRHP